MTDHLEQAKKVAGIGAAEYTQAIQRRNPKQDSPPIDDRHGTSNQTTTQGDQP